MTTEKQPASIEQQEIEFLKTRLIPTLKKQLREAIARLTELEKTLESIAA